MEELCFREIGECGLCIQFTNSGPTPLPWPVPRAGENVSVRGGGVQIGDSINGIVDHVDWYFSAGNSGSPVVTVWVRHER